MRRLIPCLFITCFLALPVCGQNRIWTRHTIDNALMGADGVRLADVNGDGLPDIATGWEESGLTKVYLHPGHQQVRQHWPSVIVMKGHQKTALKLIAKIFDYEIEEI